MLLPKLLSSLVLVATGYAAGIPAPSLPLREGLNERYDHLNQQRGPRVSDSYDYVIVGGGTAGLTVADRLSADGKCEQR